MGKTEMISSGDEQRRPIAFYYGPRFFIDGKEIEMVISVEFHHPSDDVATLMFKTVGRPIIKTLGKVAFDFSPENLSDACLIVSEELKKHGDFYEAFVESVKSALTEGIHWTPEDLMDKKAEDIVRRVAGEE